MQSPTLARATVIDSDQLRSAPQVDHLAHFQSSLKLAQDTVAAVRDPLKIVSASIKYDQPERYWPSGVATRFVANNKHRPIFENGFVAAGVIGGVTAGILGVATALSGNWSPIGGLSVYVTLAAASAALAAVPAVVRGAAHVLDEVQTWRKTHSENVRKAYDASYRVRVAELTANRVGSIKDVHLARIDAIARRAETAEDRAIVHTFVSPLLCAFQNDRSVLTGTARAMVDAWQLPWAEPTAPTSQLACAIVAGNHGQLPGILRQLDAAPRAEVANAIETHLFGRKKARSLEALELVKVLRIYQAAVV